MESQKIWGKGNYAVDGENINKHGCKMKNYMFANLGP